MIKLILFTILFCVLYSFIIKAENFTTYSYQPVSSCPNILSTYNSFNNLKILDFCCLDSKVNLFSKFSNFSIVRKINQQINLEEYNVYKKFNVYENIVIQPTEFVNEDTDLNFIVNIKSICFKKLTFNMMGNSKLTLNFLLNNDILVKESKPILIIGDEENSTAVINMLNSDKLKLYKLELNTDIDSRLPSELNIQNVELLIKKGIKFNADNNKVSINNSLIQGTMNFHGSENKVIVNDTSFHNCKFEFRNEDNIVILNNVEMRASEYKFNSKNNLLKFRNVNCGDDSKIILNSSNNEINITDYFKGHIDLLHDNTTILFKNAKVENTIINFNKNNILHFENSCIKNGDIKFKGKGNNSIIFTNSNNRANFNFSNDGINYIEFSEFSNNLIDGIFNLEKNLDRSSLLNFDFKSNSKTELRMLVNGTINEFNLDPRSEILLNNKNTLYINNFHYSKDSIIGIYLNKGGKFYLDIRKFNFSKDSPVVINIYNIRDLLSSDSNEKEYKLFKSTSKLDENLNIKVNANLSDYYIKVKNNEIVLVIKKNEKDSVVELVKKYYKGDKNIFGKKDFLNLAEYLDILASSKSNNSSQVDPILDYLYNNTKFNSFLSSLFPVSNNILYRGSYDTALIFLDEIHSKNSKNPTHERNIWYSGFHLEDKFILGNSKTTNINLVGNAVALGIVYPINSYLDTGLSLGCSYNNINKYSYDINLFSINLATHTKICLTNRLCNFSTVSLNLHNFDVQRKVVMYEYDSLNCSSPLVKNLIFYNVLSYSMDILNNQTFTFNITPNIRLALGKMVLSDYNETGKESLNVEGFNLFTNTTEIGITTSMRIHLTKAYLNSNFSIGTGYEFNNLRSTIFSFTDVKSTSHAKLADYNNNQSYLKFETGLVYTPINNIYDINLLLSYKNSKLGNNTKISVAMSFRF